MPGKANTINHKEENTGMEIKGKVHYVGAVSYTHLTLPTIA